MIDEQSIINRVRQLKVSVDLSCMHAHTLVSKLCGCEAAFVFVHACMCVFLPQQAPQCSLPARSINAQPCPRLICHSCCIFAFILICTSPLNWLSICPSRCSNLIVFVHYRWASNKADAHTSPKPPLSSWKKPPPNHTHNTYSQTVNICFIFNVLASH